MSQAPGVYRIPSVNQRTLIANGSGNEDVIAQVWDLGDSTIVQDVLEVSHVYQEAGTYQVRMTLSWNCASLEFNQTVEVLLPRSRKLTHGGLPGESYLAGGRRANGRRDLSRHLPGCSL